VATDCRSGPREILLEGKLGRLAPVDEAEALAGAIIETLDSPGDRHARIARAHEFSLESAVDRYLSAIGWSH
jgi:glycosyltransferase involved in cell wall biosynthesis